VPGSPAAAPDTAIVLVGGFGTRLRPLTATIPKPLLGVGDRPMICHTFDRLAAAGVRTVVLALAFAPDAFTAAFPTGRYRDLELRYTVEPEPLGTGGAIAWAAREADVSGQVFVLNGDVLTDADLTELNAFHQSHAGAASVSLIEVADPSRFGVVVTAADGKVEAFVEKPPAGTEPARTVNAGTYLLDLGLFDQVTFTRPVSVEREVFPQLAAAGQLYAVTQTSDVWIDAGTFPTLIAAHQAAVDGRLAARSEAVHPSASCAATELHGSYVAAGADVGAGVRLVDSVVYDGARVGDDATLVRTIVGPGVQVAAGSQLCDTVVAR
jgi:mannose-1-phosphate guanylyltransferase